MADTSPFVSSPWGFAPIAVELSAASIIYLYALNRNKLEGNFSTLIIYSGFKLLAIAAVFSTNLNIFSIGNLPFLAGLLMNEVVLLILMIKEQNCLRGVSLKSMYTKRDFIMRNIAEILLICILLGIAFGAPSVECRCTPKVTEILGTLDVRCSSGKHEGRWGDLISPQLRGLSFAISAVAGVVSAGGIRLIINGLVSGAVSAKHREDFFESFITEPRWKGVVRQVYSWLAFVTVFLFLFSYFTPGTRECALTENISIFEDSCVSIRSKNDKTFYNADECPLRHTLGAVSSALLNAMLAISQMFVFDLMTRLIAKNQLEIQHNKLDEEIGNTENSVATSS